MSDNLPDSSYATAISRLKTLVGRLESAQVDVDELEVVVKESVTLVNLCRSRLRATQTSVDSLLSGLKDDATQEPDHGGAKPVEIDPFADE